MEGKSNFQVEAKALWIGYCCCLLATIIHFIDNYVFLEEYAYVPSEPWMIPVSWAVQSCIGLAGVVRCTDRRHRTLLVGYPTAAAART